jgi:hypothetical protein
MLSTSRISGGTAAAEVGPRTMPSNFPRSSMSCSCFHAALHDGAAAALVAVERRLCATS